MMECLTSPCILRDAALPGINTPMPIKGCCNLLMTGPVVCGMGCISSKRMR